MQVQALGGIISVLLFLYGLWVAVVKIFISYRRADSNEESRFIYHALASRFGKENIFRDKDRIPKGHDFRKTIEQYVFDSDEMLVLIGEKWLDIREDSDPSKRRLDNPEDFVRIEIAMGFRHVDTVTPIVVQNAPMPGENELPPRLAQLGWQNAYFLRPDYFDEDLQNLVEDIASRHNQVIDVNVSSNDDEVISKPSPLRWLLPIGVIALILLGIAWMSGMVPGGAGNETPEPSATTEIEQSENTISDDDARATGEAEAWATLTSLAPTNTPTITPISSGDIQNTARAEAFAEATSSAQTESAIAQLTQNAVLTEQFIAGSTATYIAQLSLTPLATNTPVPPTATNTPIPPTATEAFNGRTVITTANIQNLEANMVLRNLLGYSIVFSPDNQYLASFDSEGVVIWDVDTGRILERFATDNQRGELAFSPDGTELAIATFEDIYIWDLISGQKIRDVADDLLGPNVEYSPEGDMLAMGECTTVSIWDTQTWETLFTEDFDENGACPDVEFSPDNRYLAIGVSRGNSISGRVEILDIEQNEVIYEFQDNSGWDISYSYDGNILLLADGYKIVDVVETDTWNRLFTIDNNERVFAVDYHPGGQLFTTGGMTVRIWDNNGNLLRNLYPETEGFTVDQEYIDGERNENHPYEQAWDLSFSPDGTMLAVASADYRSITIWTVADD